MMLVAFLIESEDVNSFVQLQIRSYNVLLSVTLRTIAEVRWAVAAASATKVLNKSLILNWCYREKIIIKN